MRVEGQAGRICFIGALALALAMGIGRFAFTPLLPLMVRDGVLRSDSGACLALSNYVGYFVGALWIAPLPIAPVRQIKWGLAGIAAATLAMGVTRSFPAWLTLRSFAGVFSASVLIAASSWSLPLLARSVNRAWVGLMYSGVGLGIAGVGSFCWLAAKPGLGAQALWVQIGAICAVMAAGVFVLLGRTSSAIALVPPTKNTETLPRSSRLLIACYGLAGFGYVLPATFLPALARTFIDDPRKFGLVWPVFGLTALLSTILAAAVLGHLNRLKLWSLCSVTMATGAILPTLWRSLSGVVVAGFLVGGTFMVITMVGLQEAAARAPARSHQLLSRMTAAFAIGQILGPLFLALISDLSVHSPLDLSLRVAAIGLFGSAAMLWRLSYRS
jgi:Uncharacterised MFS-type transporter YbfB